MTRFLDGPAQGVSLNLSRAPVFLRVTRDAATGAFDALDRFEDEPLSTETIYVYVLAGRTGSVHLDYLDAQGRRRGRTEPLAEYRLCETQPIDAVTRDTDTWRHWCIAEQALRAET